MRAYCEGEMRNFDFEKNIEKSTRKVFKLFFGSRLYMRRGDAEPVGDNVIGVNMMMDVHGSKRLSLYMDKRTIASLKERLGATGGADVDYDLIGEMANMIAGNAICFTDASARISPPEKAAVGMCDIVDAMKFTSKLGRFAIAIQDMQ